MTLSLDATLSETIDLLHRRTSVRGFTADPVPEPLLDRLLCAALRAPTSFNLQAYAMVVISDPDRRRQLAALVNQPHVGVAPVTVVICTDLARLYELGHRSGEPVGPQHQDLLLTSIVDASLAGMCLALSAESVGLGTVMLGAVRNRPEAIAGLLGLPAGVTALFGICLGWPAGTPVPRPRMRADLLVHPQTYDSERASRATTVGEESLWRASAPVTAQDAETWQHEIVRGLRKARSRTVGRLTPDTQH
jgi:nitroreductase